VVAARGDLGEQAEEGVGRGPATAAAQPGGRRPRHSRRTHGLEPPADVGPAPPHRGVYAGHRPAAAHAQAEAVACASSLMGRVRSSGDGSRAAAVHRGGVGRGAPGAPHSQSRSCQL
jgi:hypothetical protein